MKKSLNTTFIGLLALGALLAAPADVRAQTFYFTTGDQIDKLSSTGVVSTFATLPGGSNPYGLAFDGSGNLYTGGWQHRPDLPDHPRRCGDCLRDPVRRLQPPQVWPLTAAATSTWRKRSSIRSARSPPPAW